MRSGFQVAALFLALFLSRETIRAQFTRAPAPSQQQASYPYAQQPPPAAGYSDGQAPADDPEAAADQGHGVARLSIMLGEVNIRRGDNSEISAAVVNAPIQQNDRVQTSGNGAAEIQIDGGNVVRVAENSDIAFTGLQLRRVQIQIGAGSMLYRVLRANESAVEIDTPSVAIRPNGPGAIRVTLLSDGVTRISLYTGSAKMLGTQGAQPLRAGSTVLVRAADSGPEYQETASLRPDPFDNWSASRDSELLSSQSAQLIGEDMSGAEDLDRNGSWVQSQYGQVWAPRDVSQDWAPYSNGEWTWQGYYGWTWVDYSPWGWAPYHYGRWFRNGGYGWCWWPGGARVHHVWRPALVGFFGSGQGLGWVALAPHESFQAWWGRRSWIDNSGGGYTRYGTGSVRFQNAGFRGAALFASRDNFSGPHRRFSVASSEQLRGATRFNGQIPVAPNRGSYRFSDRQTFATRRVSGGFARPTPGVAKANGWQSFGAPGSQSGYQRGAFSSAPRGEGESGWHQFGRPPAASLTPNERSQFNSYRSYRNNSPAVGIAPSVSARGPSNSTWRSFGNTPAAGGSWSGGSRNGAGQQRYEPRPTAPPSRPSSPIARESYRAPSGGSHPAQSHFGRENRGGGGRQGDGRR